MTRLTPLAALPLVLAGCAPGMMNPNPGEITADRACYTGDHACSAEIVLRRAERGEPWAELRMG